MPVNRMFLCAAAVMFAAPITSTETACQIEWNALYCSNMTEPQFMDDSKVFMNSNIYTLKLENVNISKLPAYKKWLSDVRRIDIAHNRELMSAEFIQNLHTSRVQWSVYFI